VINAYSIGQLAKRLNLSRSTLLYYDTVGLAAASARTGANYREYSEEDVKRLEQICIYRQAGLPLKDIKKILGSPENLTVATLEKRLEELNEEIQKLRNQQHFIIRILKNDQLLKHIGVINLDTWITLLKSVGLSQEDMEKWHSRFEKSFPEEHQFFLESLGLPPEEIKKIRALSRNVEKTRL
jgi:DNA-binding transcriptional MerR regulator